MLEELFLFVVATVFLAAAMLAMLSDWRMERNPFAVCRLGIHKYRWYHGTGGVWGDDTYKCTKCGKLETINYYW